MECTSRLENSSFKEEDAVYVPVTDKDDEFLMETEDVRQKHVGMQHIIEATLHILQETTLERHTDEMLETIVVSLLEVADHKDATGEMASLYEAVKKVVHRVIVHGAVNEFIHMRIDNLSKLQEFVQHFA